jgi:hypothetical protein
VKETGILKNVQTKDVIVGLPEVAGPVMLRRYPACAVLPHGKSNDEHRFFVLATSSEEASKLAKEHANELSFSRVFLESWEGELVLDGPMVA